MNDEVKEKINEIVSKGGLYSTLYIDMHAKTEEELQELLVALLAQIGNEVGVVFYVGKILSPLKENEMVSTTAEINLLVDNPFNLHKICLKYMPVGMEITDPVEVKVKSSDLSFMMLESGSLAHEYSRMVLNQRLDKGEYSKYMGEMKNRRVLGKDLLDKAD